MDGWLDQWVLQGSCWWSGEDVDGVRWEMAGPQAWILGGVLDLIGTQLTRGEQCVGFLNE